MGVGELSTVNAQDPSTVARSKARDERLSVALEDALYGILRTKKGRIAIAWLVRGTHNLGHVYTPGMTFDMVAFEAGKQYDARELIRTIRRTERCSKLFDQALREYDNEWCSSDTG